MPGQENTRKHGVGQSAGSLGKLRERSRKCEGICEKPIQTQGLGGITGWVYRNPVKT